MAPRTANPNSLTFRVRKLVVFARAVDVAKTKLDALPDADKLRAEFNEATRRAGGSATDENLVRLEQASKALRRGDSKKRERATAAHADALHRFRLELGRLASDTKEN